MLSLEGGAGCSARSRSKVLVCPFRSRQVAVNPRHFACTVKYSCGTKRLISSSRSTIRARVGVWTRPAEAGPRAYR